MFGGAVASLSMKIFDRADLPAIKTIVYMRAVQSFFLLLRKKLASLSENEDGFELPAGGFLLPMAGTVIVVYALMHEALALPPSMKSRILDLVQETHGEALECKAWDAVNVANIERIYGKRLY